MTKTKRIHNQTKIKNGKTLNLINRFWESGFIARISTKTSQTENTLNIQENNFDFKEKD